MFARPNAAGLLTVGVGGVSLSVSPDQLSVSPALRSVCCRLLARRNAGAHLTVAFAEVADPDGLGRVCGAPEASVARAMRVEKWV